MPKYVVSSTLADPDWSNTTVLSGDLVEEVTRLKASVSEKRPLELVDTKTFLSGVVVHTFHPAAR